MPRESVSEDGVMERNLALEVVRVTEAAALAASRLMGRGDEKAADQAAVNAMRQALSTMQIDGTVVIGEGERDEAPMLYIGEKVGVGKGPEIDIALDPLEGTTITAKGGPNALAVVAMANKGGFLHAPDTYMEKIAVGPEAAGLISESELAGELGRLAQLGLRNRLADGDDRSAARELDEDVPHLALEVQAVVEDQIGRGETVDVARGRLVEVRIDAGAHQGHDLDAIAAHIPHHVAKNAERGDSLNLVIRGCRLCKTEGEKRNHCNG